MGIDSVNSRCLVPKSIVRRFCILCTDRRIPSILPSSYFERNCI